MKTRFAWIAVAAILLGVIGFAAGPSSASLAAPQQAQAKNPLANIPVTGTVAGNGTLQGVMDVTNFTVAGSQLLANGLLDATLYDANGNVIGRVSNTLVQGLPVSFGGQQSPQAPTAPSATCHILNLTLGPLDLNLLGLMVHLNQVHLTIDAQSGPGNLLGNLLCAVAGLLDNPLGNYLNQISDLLNRIVDILGSLTP